MTLVEWVDKVLQQSLKKKPSNLGLGFVKFGNRIILPWFQVWSKRSFHYNEGEDSRNSCHLDATMQTGDSEDEVEIAINLLNIVGSFQGVTTIICTKAKCPASPIFHYYVKCHATLPPQHQPWISCEFRRSLSWIKSPKCFIPKPTSF